MKKPLAEIKKFFGNPGLWRGLALTLVYIVFIGFLAFLGMLALRGAIKAHVVYRISNEPAGEYECIMVLGCQVKANGRPSDMLRDRVLTGVRLYKAGVAPKLLMSGDSEREGYDETGAMKALAVSEGVPEEDILCDPYGLCTYDSAARTKSVFGFTKIVIVTQEYHLTRALWDAEGVGIDAAGTAADLDVYGKQVYRNIREVVACFKDYYWTLRGHTPQYAD